MRFLSPILQEVVYPALGKVGVFHRNGGSSLRVVTYHGVLPENYRSTDAFLDSTLVSLTAFRQQLRLLKKHYHVISPDQFRGWLQGLETLPDRSVLLTCDDGLINNLTVMLPVLQEERLQCLFFITGASTRNVPSLLWYVELYLMLMAARADRGQNKWNDILLPAISSDPENRRSMWLRLLKDLSVLSEAQRAEFLSVAREWCGLDAEWGTCYLNDSVLSQRYRLLLAREMKELADAGMTMGVHTMSHPVLAQQSVEMARSEITDCREKIEGCLKSPVWALAYPFGDPASVGNREYRLAEAAKYECAFVNVGGSCDETNSKFSLPRIHVTGSMSLSTYEAHISGFHHALQTKLRGRSDVGRH
jgi:peptidoglycan/xylan/chitin deacetylase (PgdA/CDA1 family)